VEISELMAGGGSYQKDMRGEINEKKK